MAKDEDKLTKKEQEIIEILNRDGQVIVDDIKDLNNLSKKLEKTLGKADVI